MKAFFPNIQSLQQPEKTSQEETQAAEAEEDEEEIEDEDHDKGHDLVKKADQGEDNWQEILRPILNNCTYIFCFVGKRRNV